MAPRDDSALVPHPVLHAHPGSIMADAPSVMRRLNLSVQISILVLLLVGSALATIFIQASATDVDERSIAGIVRQNDSSMDQVISAQVGNMGRNTATMLALLGHVHAAETDFQRQILDWRSLLQRGGRPDQKAVFTTAFRKREALVHHDCDEAQSLMGDDAELLTLLQHFRTSYDKLTQSYHTGMGIIDLAETFQEGAKAADDYMINEDLEPIATLAALVGKTKELSDNQVRSMTQSSHQVISEVTKRNSTGLEDAIAATRTRNHSLALVSALVIAVIALASIVLARHGLRPLRAAIQALDALAQGDLTHKHLAPGDDEVGHMTKALGRAIDGTRQSVNRITQDAHTLTDSMNKLSASGIDLRHLMARTLESIETSSKAGKNIAETALTVSSAMEEMTSSVNEISQSCSLAATAGSIAARDATEAEKHVAHLLGQSAEISDITKMIAAIAAETNMLALNATIEAARAGDLGKGFAVVAGEVKQLSQRTSEATIDISMKVGAIQAGSHRVKDAIAAIITHIHALDDMQRAIAAAVTQQSASTQEVANRMSDVSRGCETIAVQLSTTGTTAKAAQIESDRVSLESSKLHVLITQQQEVIARFTL